MVRWSSIKTWGITSDNRTGTDELYAIGPDSADYTQSDMICYSASLDIVTKQQLASYVV